MSTKFSISRAIAPEDIRPGMYVVVLCVIHEYMLVDGWDPTVSSRPRTLRVNCLCGADGDPLRVVAVCLPFVQVECPEGRLRALDVRQQKLAAVSESYALEAFTRPERS